MVAEKFVPIKTTYWAKPIPDRKFDWCATREDYEPPDSDGVGENGCVGYGPTELQAINDLLEREWERE